LFCLNRTRVFPKVRPLKLGFFRRNTLNAARNLIGMLLIHRSREGITAGIIVETEGYMGKSDPGSHAHRGRRIRNAPMFGRPGRAYVYKCHMYPLLNVVTEGEGTPGAVLLRALQPVAGIPLMRLRRGTSLAGELANGPGRLTAAMGIGLSHNRTDLLNGRLCLLKHQTRIPPRVRRTTRIGLSGPAALLPWRFIAADNPFVSHV
jgi:DNA-3-methyladenine glycosylase